MLIPWWRHQMEAFSALLAICAGNSPVSGEFPTQRPVTRSFDVYFDLRPNKRLSKQSWGWWFETPSRPSWRHRNTVPGSQWSPVVSPSGGIIFLSLWVNFSCIEDKHCLWKIKKTWSNEMQAGKWCWVAANISLKLFILAVGLCEFRNIQGPLLLT